MRKKLVPIVIVLIFGGLVTANLVRTTFSVQKRTTFAQVESSSLVSSALGSPVEIGWPKGKGLERWSTRDDADVISFRFPVYGPKGEGELSGLLQNVDGQGWAGEYKVETVSKPVMVDGKYVSSPSRVLGVGGYELDGRAKALRAPAP